ncbi:MAG: hypothetical protein ACK5ND_00415 [Bacteroides sp.]
MRKSQDAGSVFSSLVGVLKQLMYQFGGLCSILCSSAIVFAYG